MLYCAIVHYYQGTLELCHINSYYCRHPFVLQLYVTFYASRTCNEGKHPLVGKHLVASVFSSKPFIDVDQATQTIQGGVIVDLLDTLADHFGFSSHINLAEAGFKIYPNGTFGGSLGDVIIAIISHHLGQKC